MRKWNKIFLIFGLVNIIIIIADATVIPLKNHEVVVQEMWSVTHRNIKGFSHVEYFFSANKKEYKISAYLYNRLNVDDSIIIQRSVLTNSFQAYYLQKENLQYKDGIFNYEVLGVVLLCFNGIGLLLLGTFDRKLKIESGKRNLYFLLAAMSLCLQLVNIFFN